MTKTNSNGSGTGTGSAAPRRGFASMSDVASSLMFGRGGGSNFKAGARKALDTKYAQRYVRTMISDNLEI